MVLLHLVHEWECRFCTFRDTTVEARPHTRFHDCAALGLSTPMVQVGSKARVTVNEREDYVAKEKVQTANGRPVMSIVTERPDGSTDIAVYPPTAYAEVR